ncbi:hypothetical protein GCM10028812_17270 [Ancylobacter sonchi]
MEEKYGGVDIGRTTRTANLSNKQMLAGGEIDMAVDPDNGRLSGRCKVCGYEQRAREGWG